MNEKMESITEIIARINLRESAAIPAPRPINQYGYKDEFDRNVFVKNKDFNKYLITRKLNLGQIVALSVKKKREFYMTWKHGMNDQNTNEEFEKTKAMLHYRDKEIPLEHIADQWRTWVKREREFESYCSAIMSIIGLHEVGTETKNEDIEDQESGPPVERIEWR